MTLPLQLDSVSPAFAALTAGPRAAGAAAAAAAAEALGRELGVPVRIDARAVPGVPAVISLGTTTLCFDVAVPGGRVALDVDAGLASALTALLAGSDGDVPPALAVVPAERAALELLALIALGGVRAGDGVAALAPRLVRADPPGRGCLAVELAVQAGAARGTARLIVPRAVIAALDGPAAGEVPDVRVAAGLRRGTVTLTLEEAAAVRAGDVVLLDEAGGRDGLALPGGLVLLGRYDGDGFTVEERTMDDWNGSFPIALSVEIARVAVALRDLAGLAPGGVLPLNAPRDGRVTLRVGEVAVGRGELVEVDGALAVRIAAWEGCR